MTNLIDRLKMLNAKERYLLVSQILGNTSFQPSENFLEELKAELGIEIPAANDIFAAMDYHLDWLYAALKISGSDDDTVCDLNECHGVKGTQEDVDFLLAWKNGEIFHLAIIEAKGVTSWTNKQIESKSKRLGNIFGDDGKNIENVIPHFVLMSPRKSVGLRKNECPDWMCPGGQFHWIKLKNPNNYGTHKVCRCSSGKEIGKEGKHWAIFAR